VMSTSVHVCLCVCLCPRGYLRNHTPHDLYKIFVHVTYGPWSSSSVVSVRCVLPDVTVAIVTTVTANVGGETNIHVPVTLMHGRKKAKLI